MAEIRKPSPTVRSQLGPRPAAFQEDPTQPLREASEVGNILNQFFGQATATITDLQRAQHAVNLYEVQVANQEQASKGQADRLAGLDPDESLVDDLDYINAYQDTSAELTAVDKVSEWQEQVFSQWTPGDGFDLRAATEEWLAGEVRAAEDMPDRYKARLAGSFMNKIQRDLDDADRRDLAVVRERGRSQLATEFRQKVRTGEPLSVEGLKADFARARKLMPYNTDGEVRAWTLAKHKEGALAGGLTGVQAFRGLMKSLDPDEKPPEADAVMDQLDAEWARGLSGEANEAYANLTVQVSTAENYEQIEEMTSAVQSIHNRYGNPQAKRNFMAQAMARKAQIANAIEMDRALTGALTGQGGVLPVDPKDADDAILPKMRALGLLDPIPTGDQTVLMQKTGQRANTLVHLSRSMAIPKNLKEYYAGQVLNFEDPAAMQGSILTLHQADRKQPGLAAEIFSGQPEARATYEGLVSAALGGAGNFEQRLAAFKADPKTMRQAFTTPLSELAETATDAEARDRIINAHGYELPLVSGLSRNDQSAVRLLVGYSNTNADPGDTTMSAEMERRYIDEVRYQLGVAKATGRPISLDDARARAAKSFADRLEALPVDAENGYLAPITRNIVGALSGSTDLADQAFEAVQSSGIKYRLDIRQPAVLTPENPERPPVTAVPFTADDQQRSPLSLLTEDVAAYSRAQGQPYALKEGPSRKDGYMEVWDTDRNIPVKMVVGQTGYVKGVDGTQHSFEISNDAKETQQEFEAARDAAGLPPSLTLLPSRGQARGITPSYQLLVGTRYPDDYEGSPKLAEARRQQAQDQATKQVLTGVRARLQDQGLTAPAEGFTNMTREPGSFEEPDDYVDYLIEQVNRGRGGGQLDDPKDLTQSYRRDRGQFLRSEEGLRLTAYKDTNGIDTVGYGFNLEANKDLFLETLNASETEYQAVRSGRQPLTVDDAELLFEASLDEAEEAVIRKVGDVPLRDHQRIALVSLAYNGGPRLVGPGLISALQNRDMTAAAKEVLYRSGVTKDPELKRRRWREAYKLLGNEVFDALMNAGVLPDLTTYVRGG